MGKRGRVHLKRIENKNNRQVSFSKKKPSLIKKANEISVVCDAEVDLIVFSPKGELFEYPTDACMDAILERYERQCCVAEELVATDQELWVREYCIYATDQELSVPDAVYSAIRPRYIFSMIHGADYDHEI